jgi:hypothetical protein
LHCKCPRLASEAPSGRRRWQCEPSPRIAAALASLPTGRGHDSVDAAPLLRPDASCAGGSRRSPRLSPEARRPRRGARAGAGEAAGASCWRDAGAPITRPGDVLRRECVTQQRWLRRIPWPLSVPGRVLPDGSPGAIPPAAPVVRPSKGKSTPLSFTEGSSPIDRGRWQIGARHQGLGTKGRRRIVACCRP